MLTRIGRQRRDFVLGRVERKHLRILEIGAFDNPTFHRALEDDVRYLDFFSGPELREMHRDNPRRKFEAIVDVDYVVKSRDFADEVNRGGAFDIIVANHVIEHVPDSIHWFRQVFSLLSPGGIVFLSVPDRRYTFDFFRPVSLATHMIRAHRDSLEKPDIWQLTDHFYYHQKVDLEEIWAGRPPLEFKPRFSLEEAIKMAEEKSRVYTDAHCWVFEPESFRRCITDLVSATMIEAGVDLIRDTQPGTHEFWAILTHPKMSFRPLETGKYSH